MLTLQECRKYAGSELTDEKLEAARDALYVFANKIVEDWLCLEDGENETVCPQNRVAITSIPRHNIT
jgi:hypothetical protein